MSENFNKFVPQPRDESKQDKIIRNLARAVLGGIAITIAAESIMLGKKKK